MLTTFEQVRDWITDNGLKRWVLYRDRNKTEKLLDSASFPSDEADKIAMTEKYLRLNGGTAYALGATTNAASDLSLVCEIRLQEAQPAMPVNGMGYQPQPVDEDKIAQRIEAKLRAEYERKEYERKLADLEKREKEFQEKQNSAMGALTHYFAPIGQALLQRGMRNVAGVDSEEPVHAPAIQPLRQEPETQEPQEPEEEEVFTEEESERLFDLMKRFKAVEPQYLELIEGVVKMKESGNPMYETAKSFLLK